MTDPANVSPMHPGGGSLPPPRPRTWPVVLLGVVILICGNVIGAGTAVLWLKQYLPPHPPPDVVAAERITQDMQGRYNLTEEQSRKVQELMQKSIEALDAIHRDAQEKGEAQRQMLRSEMKTILTPDQYAQWAAHFEQVGARRGPPGGPGAGQGPGGPGREGGGRPGPGVNPPYPPQGKGPPGGQPGMGGGPGQGPGRPPLPGAGRGPGQEGGPMRPLPPEGRRGPPAALPPGSAGPGNPPPPVAPPGGPEAARPSEPPPQR